MSHGQHFTTCFTCGKQYICGDCITHECPECEDKRGGKPQVEMRLAAEIAASSLRADRARLEWLVKHEAFVTKGSRCKTRRGGLAPDNMETIYQIDWVNEDQSQQWHSADGGMPDWRAAIDDAMRRCRSNAQVNNSGPVTPK